MRSATGTKSEDPSVVTRLTKVMMDFFETPSFHDGNGSPARAGLTLHAIARSHPQTRSQMLGRTNTGGPEMNDK
jgi:hypothetical protein